MRVTETIPAAPLAIPKTTRRVRQKGLTSFDAGKMIPVGAGTFWLHREDAVRRGTINLKFQMQETAELLMNGLGINCWTYFVPMLAFDRFSGSLQELNRSYAGENGIGGSVVPFFEKNKYWNGTSVVTSGTPATEDTRDFYQVMGKHFAGSNINTTYVEAYNAIINHLYKARSADLELRNDFDHTLAEAFWLNNGFNHIVPDYDQAIIDGTVSMGANAKGQIFADRLNRQSSDITSANASTLTYGSNGSLVYSPGALGSEWTLDNGEFKADMDALYVELSGMNMSLANIELAKKTAAMAKIRQKYDGIDDEYVIDLLMSGTRVPEEAMKQPVLLARGQGLMNYTQRYATDAANLDESATNGHASVTLNYRTPPMNTGGVVMTLVSIVPEQIWERKKDHFLYTVDATNLPNALPDMLDPEKVRVVKNEEADVNHATPDGTFGYAPLNTEWEIEETLVGGKYYRPADDAFDEDRQKIWSAETTNPTLNTDWYLCTNLHKKVFADQTADSFEMIASSAAEVVGNTQFGKRLIEADATSDYAHIEAQVEETRITK